MIARYYPSLKALRVFKADDSVLCDIPYEHAVAHGLLLDMVLKCVRLRRNKSEWQRVNGALTAKVRWK